MIATAMVGIALTLQAVQATPVRAERTPVAPAVVPAPTDSTAHAVRAEDAPVIDGKDADRVWSGIPAITAFKQWRPTEGKAPRFKTEAKIAYD